MYKVGIVGLGHLGEIHLQQWLEIVGSSILCFDNDKNIVEKIQAKYTVSFVDTYQELLAQCDIIDVVTPTQFHYIYAKEAIESGKHVFIEKPICQSNEEATSLFELSQKHSVKVQVGHVERFNPAFVSVQELISDPKFFEIHRLAPYNPRGTEVSVIMDLMIHDLDIMLSLVKSPVKNIYANGVCILNKTPDIANARLEFANGCIANLTASRISMKKMRKMRIFKPEMYATIDFLDKKAEVYEIVAKEDSKEGVVFSQFDGDEKKLVFISPQISSTNSIQEELKSFTNSIKNNTETKVPILDAMNALSLAIEIQQKIHS